VKKKKREAAQKKALEEKQKQQTSDTPKDEIESAKERLTSEIMKNLPEELRSAFTLYSQGIEPSHLMGLLGVEITRLQMKQAEGDYDYRDATHFHRTMDQARRIQTMNTLSDAYIPDKINVQLVPLGNENEEDYGDEPEFA
jgi:hypothetical protein